MNNDAYQAMPYEGQLAQNLNLSPEAMSERIAPFQQDTVYCYVVETVKYCEGRLYQTGSGPNFQGDLLTLCSCKHQMRTYLDVESWKGVWVAGYTSRTHLGSHRLFYLMMVAQAFESHRELWLSDAIPEATKLAKASHLDGFGDIYQPTNGSGSPYLPWNYLEPCKNNVHCEPGDWRKDIKYPARNGRRPALLAGHPEYSFLWDKPVIRSPFEIRRGERRKKLSDLFSFH